MRQTTRKWNFRNCADFSLVDISRMHDPILRGALQRKLAAWSDAYLPKLLLAVLLNIQGK